MYRVLLTGATGFIGRSLGEELVKRGYLVYGMVRFSSSKKPVGKGVTPIYGDLIDRMSVEHVIRSVKPDVVIHIGALTPVAMSYNMPRAYAETNYIGTINVAEAVRKYGENVKLFVYASTSEVYGQHDKFPLKESYEARPNTPYAVSKYAGELYLKYYMREAYDFPLLIIRPFNTYGRANVNQPHYVIEKIITTMLKGEETLTLGDKDAIRDFVFRDDHVRAYVMAIEKALNGDFDFYGETINISTGEGYTIEEMVNKIANMIGWAGEVKWGTHYRPADIKVLIGDNTKARKLLGWKPEYNIDLGLEKAIEEWRRVLNE